MNDDFFVVDEEFFRPTGAAGTREEGWAASWTPVVVIKAVNLALAATAALALWGGATNLSRCEAALAAIVRPASSPEEASGRDYAAGKMSLQEVAATLGLSTTDSVFWLDLHGFARDIKRIRLGPEKRRERLESIARERKERRGEPVVDLNRVEREVASSQRIEGVDARPWLTHLKG